MAIDVKPRDDFGTRLAAHHERYGQCAIEAGLVGKLADHECKHGFLPGDAKVTCTCFRAKKMQGKR